LIADSTKEALNTRAFFSTLKKAHHSPHVVQGPSEKTSKNALMSQGSKTLPSFLKSMSSQKPGHSGSGSTLAAAA
jgi:hypothetical protein